MRGSIVRCFLEVSMINGHDGLSEIAAKEKIKVAELETGQYVVFVNKARDRIKVFAAEQIVAYVRLTQGRKVDLRVIREIPRVFTGAQMNYDKALDLMLSKKL
jgi:hypothetical protein